MCIIVKVMKKSYILVLFAVMLLVTGCDFFRKVVGRPTSDEIEVRRVAVEQDKAQKAELAREQARLDSLAEVKQRMMAAKEMETRDSLAAHTALKEKGCVLYDLSSLKGLASGELAHRYYLIVGSFRDAANADKFMSKIAEDSAMEPVQVHFRTGIVAVGVCPRDKITQMVSVIDEVRTKSFCPKDAWILVNEQ